MAARIEIASTSKGITDLHLDEQPAIASRTLRNFTLSPRILTYQYHIPHGYDSTDVDYLGDGSIGNVIKVHAVARDDRRIRDVAIKKMHNPFRSVETARRVFREIRLLQSMRHENVIRALDMYSPDTEFTSFNEIYVVTEYAGYSLYEVLKNQREKDIIHLQFDHIKFIVYQLIRGLKYLHSANVAIRDLKPSSILINSTCDIVIGNFGLHLHLMKDEKVLMPMRWYRSPEVIFWKIDGSAKPADIWSVGCIFAEMMINQPLFPGETTNAQYDMITNVCGAPDQELLQKIEDSAADRGRIIREVIERLSYGRQRSNFTRHFRSFNPELPDDAISFLEQILQMDPERRLTVEQTLQHPYLCDYRDPKDEPTAAELFTIEDNVENTIEDWKRVIWNEIQNYSGDERSPPFI